MGTTFLLVEWAYDDEDDDHLPVAVVHLIPRVSSVIPEAYRIPVARRSNGMTIARRDPHQMGRVKEI